MALYVEDDAVMAPDAFLMCEWVKRYKLTCIDSRAEGIVSLNKYTKHCLVVACITKPSRRSTSPKAGLTAPTRACCTCRTA